MTRPMIRIHNTAIDEVIDREMTVAEFEQYQIEQDVIAQHKAEAELKAIAKADVLKRLGLTEDEAKLLFS